MGRMDRRDPQTMPRELECSLGTALGCEWKVLARAGAYMYDRAIPSPWSHRARYRDQRCTYIINMKPGATMLDATRRGDGMGLLVCDRIGISSPYMRNGDSACYPAKEFLEKKKQR